MADLGFPVNYQAMRPMEFFPVGLEGLTLLAIKRLFDYNDKKFQEMASSVIKLPFIIRRVFMYSFKLFPIRVRKEVGKMWNIYYTTGKLKITEIDEKRRRLVVRLENFSLHPLHCQVIQGYIINGAPIILKGRVDCKETKCSFRGDKYHEFVLTW